MLNNLLAFAYAYQASKQKGPEVQKSRKGAEHCEQFSEINTKNSSKKCFSYEI